MTKLIVESNVVIDAHRLRQLLTIGEEHDMVSVKRQAAVADRERDPNAPPAQPGQVCHPVTLVIAPDGDGIPRATCPACGKGWPVP